MDAPPIPRLVDLVHAFNGVVVEQFKKRSKTPQWFDFSLAIVETTFQNSTVDIKAAFLSTPFIESCFWSSIRGSTNSMLITPNCLANKEILFLNFNNLVKFRSVFWKFFLEQLVFKYNEVDLNFLIGMQDSTVEFFACKINDLILHDNFCFRRVLGRCFDKKTETLWTVWTSLISRWKKEVWKQVTHRR